MKKAAILLCLVFGSTYVLADEDGSYVGYDSIVNELKDSLKEAPPPTEAQFDNDWQAVAMHASLAFTTSWVNLTTPNGASSSGLLKGAEASIGMNLFNRKLRAEGAFSNFAQEDLDSAFKTDLKQFELRLVYLMEVQDKLTARFGTGLAVRSMDILSQAGGQWSSYQTSTPDWILMAGFERKITPSIALGPDLSYRSAVEGNTIDKTAWDASFRLNATF